MTVIAALVPVDAPIGLLALAALGVFVLAAGWFLLRGRAGDDADSSAALDGRLETAPLPGTDGRLRIQGDLHVKGRSVLPGSVEICGSLLLDADAEFDAVAEVQGDASFGERARAIHPLTVRGNLTLGRDARIPSCVVDGDVVLGPGACVTGSIRCGTLYLDEEEPRSRAEAPSTESLPVVSIETTPAP